jgi:hypothetical protein
MAPRSVKRWYRAGPGRVGSGRVGSGRAGSVPRPRALGLDRDLLGASVTYQFPAEGEPGYVGS